MKSGAYFENGVITYNRALILKQRSICFLTTCMELLKLKSLALCVGIILSNRPIFNPNYLPDLVRDVLQQLHPEFFAKVMENWHELRTCLLKLPAVEEEEKGSSGEEERNFESDVEFKEATVPDLVPKTEETVQNSTVVCLEKHPDVASDALLLYTP
jgi:hypothetical protein